MKTIMSINKKFTDLNPNQLINLVSDNSKYVDGYEISINFDDESQVKYLCDLAFLCCKNNLHFQVHGNSSLNIDKQVEFFEMLYPLSDMLGYKINVVLHSINSDNKEDSIRKTIDYLEELEDRIDNNKCVISLENLNDDFGFDRLNLNDIKPIVMNNENIYCTYDVGHVYADYDNAINVDKEMIELITNVHIHTHNNVYSNGFDHKPIYKDDTYWNDIIKTITLLKINKYDGPIVFEYDLYACNGEKLTDKIIDYAKSIDFVAERLKD